MFERGAGQTNGVLKWRHMKIRSEGASSILEDDTMAPPICIVKTWRTGKREGDMTMLLATEQMAQAFCVLISYLAAQMTLLPGWH